VADDVTLPGTGAVIAADEVSGKKYQVIKLALGADGAMDNLVDAGPQAGSASIPVALSDEDNAVLDTIASIAQALSSQANDALLTTGAVDSAVNTEFSEISAYPQGILVQGSDGTYRRNITTDAAGHLQVDVTSVVPGYGATNLGKREDDAHNSADTGVMVLAVRDDTLAATSGAEGDYECLHTNNNGALFTEICPGAPFTGFHDVAGGAHTDVELVAAPGAGLSLYITDVWITNDATLATSVKFEEDTASAKTQKMGVLYIPASGGISITGMRSPIKLTANKNLGFTTTGTANTSIQVSGYIAP
jgi:hypothetical protein